MRKVATRGGGLVRPSIPGCVGRPPGKPHATASAEKGELCLGIGGVVQGLAQPPPGWVGGKAYSAKELLEEEAAMADTIWHR